jgi:uncharacterized membrane protein YeiH
MSGWLSPEKVADVTRALDLTGVFANGLLGGLRAQDRDSDLFGFLVIGVASGLGGGVIRDTLLQHGPPVPLTDYAHLTTATAGTLLAFVLDLRRHTSTLAFNLLDAVALSVWAVAGAQKSLGAGLGWLSAVLLGTTTAVGGGAVRDLLLGRTPAIFGGNFLYATVAVLVSGVMLVCSRRRTRRRHPGRHRGRHPAPGDRAGARLGAPRSRDWRPPSARDGDP